MITTYPWSALSRMADMRFISASSGSQAISEAFSARIAQLALIDSLYIAIMKQLGEEGIKNVENARYHRKAAYLTIGAHLIIGEIGEDV